MIDALNVDEFWKVYRQNLPKSMNIILSKINEVVQEINRNQKTYQCCICEKPNYFETDTLVLQRKMVCGECRQDIKDFDR